MQALAHALPFSEAVIEWGRWLEREHARLAKARAHFLSVTFDRYRDRYFVPGPSEPHATAKAERVRREHVIAGITCKLRPENAARVLLGDINRWYLRMLNAMLGGRYRDHGPLHPLGVGWIDEPAAKRTDVLRPNKRLPGDEFPNAHFVLIVPEGESPSGLGTNDRFHRLCESGELEGLWRHFNPEGSLHITDAYDVPGAVDYAAKTAKRSPVLQEHMIMLPFAKWS